MPPLRGRPRMRKSVLPSSVYESHGAYYHVVRGVWHPLGRDLATALAEYAARVSAVPEGRLDGMIDAAFLRMKRRKANPLAAATIKAYEVACAKLKHLLRKGNSLDQVKGRDVARIKELLGDHPPMANRVLVFGRLIWNDFLENQLIDSNPFVGIKRYPSSKRTRLIKPAEWIAIYAKAGARLQCIMDLLVLTGQRISDVLGIDERDLLEDGIYFKQTKTRKELIVAWNGELREAVARSRALHGKVLKMDFTVEGKPRPLFRSNRGRKPNYRTIYWNWTTAVKAAGVEHCTLHDNRAVAATEAKRQGLDATKLLGHESASTTKTYLRGREVEIVIGPKMRTA